MTPESSPSQPIERKCRGCGATLIYAEGAGRRVVPLQRVRKVYAVDAGHATVKALGELYVEHFELCVGPKGPHWKRKP